MADRRASRAVTDFIVIPVIILLGIFITANVIDSMLNLNNETFRVLFTGIGGISCFILYFKRKIEEYS